MIVCTHVHYACSGTNGASAPPGFPRAFRWAYEAANGTRTELLGMSHAGDYGGIGYADCVMADGCGVRRVVYATQRVLCF